ncbi:hypothetical protein H5410_052219 [Solanum commersonii]|uniref:Uncharacterized protein n=1 Tax=Solanum commersonii TaxID=4109 RepID=A0A9J5X3E4_SOLCO|nr:hypothetical protein H5410_052219 [Solanum commersonii]
MVIKKLEICISMVKMSIEIVAVFVDTIISKDNSSSTSHSNILPAPYVGRIEYNLENKDLGKLLYYKN